MVILVLFLCGLRILIVLYMWHLLFVWLIFVFVLFVLLVISYMHIFFSIMGRTVFILLVEQSSRNPLPCPLGYFFPPGDWEGPPLSSVRFGLWAGGEGISGSSVEAVSTTTAAAVGAYFFLGRRPWGSVSTHTVTHTLTLAAVSRFLVILHGISSYLIFCPVGFLVLRRLLYFYVRASHLVGRGQFESVWCVCYPIWLGGEPWRGCSVNVCAFPFSWEPSWSDGAVHSVGTFCGIIGVIFGLHGLLCPAGFSRSHLFTQI